jgi:rhodanese-related sulfurtransferase
MIAVGGVLPPVAYWWLLGRVPTATPAQAKELLGQTGSTAVLVDMRAPAEFAASHLDGAENWPYESIMALSSRNAVPQPFAGKPLLLICNSGFHSALATRHLRDLSVPNVTNVRGGLEAWVADAEVSCARGFCRLRAASGATSDLPFRESPKHEQWAALSIFWAIKPFYVLLSLALAAILWRAKSPDLVALRWGLLFFFAGEGFCSVNYLAFKDTSYLSEYLHSFGMVLSFGFVTFTLFEGLDRRIIKYSDPEQKCAALGLCRGCVKYTDVPCGLKRLFLYLAPAGLILSFLPLTAVPQVVSYNTRILWVFYNYSNPIVYQLFEIRWCPLLALLLFAIAFAILLFKKDDPVSPAKVFFAAATGYLGFSLFRLFLFAPFRDNMVWFIFWEEITELIYVCGVAFVLWTFRHALFARDAAAQAG